MQYNSFGKSVLYIIKNDMCIYMFSYKEKQKISNILYRLISLIRDIYKAVWNKNLRNSYMPNVKKRTLR